jgi:hypothetical protein
MPIKGVTGKSLYDIQREKRPRTKSEKKRTREEFPNDCFLVPQKKKYLICDRDAKFDCDLLRTSYMHGKTWSKRKPTDPSHKQAVSAAIKRAEKEGCSWFRGAEFPKGKSSKSKTHKSVGQVLSSRRKK